MVKNYAQWINAKYGSCYIASPSHPGYEDSDDIEVHRFFSLPVLRPPYRLGLPSIDLSFHKSQLRMHADIFHAHSPFGAGRYALSLAGERDIPLVASFHSKYYDDFYAQTKSAVIAKQLLRYTMKFYDQVDYVWTVNHATIQTMREYGYEGEVDVVPNGVDFAAPENPARLKAHLRKEFALTPPVLLFVGQHVFQKNPHLLLRSLALYKKNSGLPFTLLMAGDGNDREALEALCAELGLEQEVRFLGRIAERERLMHIYLLADLLIFPSLYDNAPLVVREAARMQTPALLIEGSNAAEGVTDCENGFLAQAAPEAISEKLEMILAQPALLSQAGRRAQETIPISWEEAVDIAVTKYEAILEHYYTKKRRRKK